MYFPYLRAKQHDLGALAELKKSIIKDDKVIPIIEPVTRINNNHYRKLKDKNVPFILVVNPLVGPLGSPKPEKSIVDNLINLELKGYKNYWLGFIIQPKTSLADVTAFISNYPNHYHAFIHFHSFKPAKDLAKAISKDKMNHYNIFIEDRVSTSYINEFDISDAQDILIKDGFKKRKRNEDYPAEDFFFDLHNIYNSELNFDGFGDFTIIGAQYEEGGGPAYIVALHLTDTDENDNLIVKHFKSDILTPPSPADPGGKFRQALKRLKKDVDTTGLTSDGINEFADHHKTGHFPGLGVAKKISIKHHIEIVHSLL